MNFFSVVCLFVLVLHSFFSHSNKKKKALTVVEDGLDGVRSHVHRGLALVVPLGHIGPELQQQIDQLEKVIYTRLIF